MSPVISVGHASQRSFQRGSFQGATARREAGWEHDFDSAKCAWEFEVGQHHSNGRWLSVPPTVVGVAGPQWGSAAVWASVHLLKSLGFLRKITRPLGAFANIWLHKGQRTG